MKWRLGNSYAFWEKSMNPYVVSDMRHYLPDTEKQLTLRVAWKFKFGHQRKSASQRMKIVEEKVRYFNNGMSIHRIQSLAGLGKMLRISYLYVTKK